MSENIYFLKICNWYSYACTYKDKLLSHIPYHPEDKIAIYFAMILKMPFFRKVGTLSTHIIISAWYQRSRYSFMLNKERGILLTCLFYWIYRNFKKLHGATKTDISAHAFVLWMQILDVARLSNKLLKDLASCQHSFLISFKIVLSWFTVTHYMIFKVF